MWSAEARPPLSNSRAWLQNVEILTAPEHRGTLGPMDWPHAPLHRFNNAGIYFITGATLYKHHFYKAPAALDLLQDLLFARAKQYYCELQAWALFSNHYHLVLLSDVGEAVRDMLARFHSDAAVAVNRHDGVSGRRVWYQFWDTQLTFEPSWLARLKYTHENAVHHRLVADARKYRWCSAGWFEENARPSLVQTLKGIKTDRVNVYDDFAALPAD
jgi:putative transposase